MSNRNDIDLATIIKSLNGNAIGKMNQLSHILKTEYDIELNFCNLVGRRWSYFAGEKDLFRATKRIKLNNSFGIITDSFLVPELEEELITLSKQLFDLN
ncbi:MAG: hypothetical protein PHR06_00880 [Candidatus Cloacimonetes bacterium]|nr:hypothetical protein [Candidatus Cloacimonadota bacterium]